MLWLSSSHHVGVLAQRAQPSLLEIPTYSIFFSSLLSRNSTFVSSSPSSYSPSSPQQRFFARLTRPMSRKSPVRNEGLPSNIRGVDNKESTKPKFHRESVTFDRNVSEVPRKRRESPSTASFSGRDGKERTSEGKSFQGEVSTSSRKRRDYSPSKSFSGREGNEGMERREQRGRERGPGSSYGSSSSSSSRRTRNEKETEEREDRSKTAKKGGGSYREREKRRKEKEGGREGEETILPPTPPLKKISEEKESTLKNGYKLRIITEDEAGMRLDHFMTQYYQLPNSLIHRLLREKKIFTGIETREKQMGSHRLVPNEHVHFWGHIANLPKLDTSERKPMVR
jgi:hypothetical protein